jgi:hypothetical protein
MNDQLLSPSGWQLVIYYWKAATSHVNWILRYRGLVLNQITVSLDGNVVWWVGWLWRGSHRQMMSSGRSGLLSGGTDTASS